MSDISKQVQNSVLAGLTPSEILDLNDRQSEELLEWNPQYLLGVLKRKFRKGEDKKRNT
jgi:hypothetical protein